MADRVGRKVVVITGASAGIGAAVAREAARQGHDLVVTARRADRLETLAVQCRASGAKVLVVPIDLSEPDAPTRLIAETVDHFGGFDVLVNNAGLGLPCLFAEGDPDELRRQLEVNFVAPLMLARLAVPYLQERRGTIINIGSAITSVSTPALGAYGATKAGLAFFNTALRRELRTRGIRVCLVEPGPIKTEFFQELAPRKREHGYNPFIDEPFDFMNISAQTTAKRIVGLIRRPVRRLSVPKRFVWPWRLFGRMLEAFPPIGDLAITSVVRFVERHPRRKTIESARTENEKHVSIGPP